MSSYGIHIIRIKWHTVTFVMDVILEYTVQFSHTLIKEKHLRQTIELFFLAFVNLKCHLVSVSNTSDLFSDYGSGFVH